jgi:D-alanyl-D-alanine carboxypeptidase (penicillin-binding protein 5/6)
MELIAVVMGCQTSKTRAAACKSMLDYGFANYALITPKLEDAVTVPVVLGREDQAAVVPGNARDLLIEKGLRNSVTTEITLEETVPAPVSRGQRLGTMTVRSGEQILAQVPMVAKEAVPRLSWWQIFSRVLRQFTMGK